MKKQTFTYYFSFKLPSAICLTAVLALMGGTAFGQLGVTIELFSAEITGDPTTARFDTDQNSNTNLDAGYIAFQICNTSGSDYNAGNLTASITEFTNVVIPANNSGTWTLAGGQAATQDIYSPTLGKGNLANGECVRLFWLIGYPTTDNQSAVNSTATINVEVTNGANSVTLAQDAETFDVQNTNSGALVQNTTLDPGPEAYVGQLLELCVTYALGNFPNAPEPIYTQPVSNNDFDAGSYQLIGAEVTAVAANLLTGISVGDIDKLWFDGVTESKNNVPNSIEVCYTFRVVKANVSPSSASPHSSHKENSGNPTKFNGSSPLSQTFPAPQCPNITLTKTASPDFLSATQLASGTATHRQVTYTVTITNNTVTTNNNPVAVSVDMIRDVLQIVDNVQLTYRGYGVGSDINNANSKVKPFYGANYGGNVPLVWQAGYDANSPPPSPYGEYYIAGNGGQLTLVYILEFPQNAPGGVWTNTATAFVGECEFSAMEIVTPIQLAYFRGQAVEDEIHLQWRTENEIDNDYMAVERSSDGRTFDEIGRVAGAGNTGHEPREYAFIDAYPRPGVNYYRLRQVDFDGTTEYHKVIAIEFGGRSRVSLSVAPNPASDLLNVNWNAPGRTDARVRLLDLQGRLQREQEVGAGSGLLNLPVHELPAGVYFLQIIQGGEVETTRFLKR